LTLVTAGRVGRPHGRDGSFYVDDASEPLELGGVVGLTGAEREPLLVEVELAEGEWLTADLEGCRVEGAGRVERVLAGPSCDVLELDDGTLLPFVSDAIRSVDVARRRIHVYPAFLGAE
jgi:16S rRNA processing protein RimM